VNDCHLGYIKKTLKETLNQCNTNIRFPQQLTQDIYRELNLISSYLTLRESFIMFSSPLFCFCFFFSYMMVEFVHILSFDVKPFIRHEMMRKTNQTSIIQSTQKM
jgi:hypothetical protein